MVEIVGGPDRRRPGVTGLEVPDDVLESFLTLQKTTIAASTEVHRADAPALGPPFAERCCQANAKSLRQNGISRCREWIIVKSISFKRHRFPADVIRHAVWLYFRFSLSFRDVEELLAQRGSTSAGHFGRKRTFQLPVSTVNVAFWAAR